MIIETSDNRFYSVQPTQDPALDHVWIGFEVKKSRSKTTWGAWVAKTNARVGLIRKEATKVVEA